LEVTDPQAADARAIDSERSLREREALNSLVRDLADSSHSIRDVLIRLADAAREASVAEGACVLQLDGEDYVAIGPSGITKPFDGVRVRMMPPPSLFREVLASQKPVVTNDGRNDPRVDPRFVDALNIRHALVVPVVIALEVTGLLLCLNSQQGAFTEHDVELVQRLADHAALALRSHELVQRAEAAAADARRSAAEASRTARHNDMLARSARVLAGSVSRDALFDGLATIVREELGATGFSVYDADASTAQARLLYQAGAARVDATSLEGGFWHTGVGRAITDNSSAFFPDLERMETRLEQELIEPLQRAGVNALAVLPLFIAEEARGALVLRYEGTHEFTPDEQQLLVDFSTHVAIALRNAGYVADLEERASRLVALSEAQQRLTRVTEQDTLAPAIADAVSAVLPGKDCDVFFTSPRGLSRVYSVRGGEVVPPSEPPPEELELVRAAFVSGVPRIATNTGATSDASEGTAELCAPVRFGDRSVGVLRVLAPDARAFEMQDLDLLTILSRHVGTAFETVRLFTAQDLQRRRAEAGAEIARAALHAANLRDGVSRLIRLLDRVVPSAGKAIGIARTRDASLEFIVTTGSLAPLGEHRLDSAGSLATLTSGNRATEYASLRDVVPADVVEDLPDEWGYVIPLGARDRTVGVLIVSMSRDVPLERSSRTTLDRLTASLSLALDALLLDEEEQQAREREQLLAKALTTINHPIFILEAGAIEYANPAAAREYGWPQQELVGMDFARFVAGVKEREHSAIGDATMERGISLSEHVHRRKDGTEFPAAVTVSEFASGPNGLPGQVVSVRNMTTERAFAEQLRHTEKMVALGELVAGVAHEINNPLTGISAFAQLLLEDSLTDEQHESVELIKRESDRAKAVIRDLLIFARKAEPATGPVDVNSLLEQTLRLRAYQLRNSGIETRVELDPTAPRLRGDAQKLQQVLLNVITNAEHAMRDSGRKQLSLRTMRHADRVIIEAADTGHGMAADVRRRVFEPFYTTKPAGVGTGLGLSVSYGIVQGHGGEIDVHSEPGEGTTIVLSLPSADVPAPHPSAEHQLQDGSRSIR
jgi:PAS domain S-box-containing protein